MTKARQLLVLGLKASAIVALLGAAYVQPRLLWNATASAPIGLYAVQPDPRPKVGDLVVVRPDPALARWMVERRYIGRHVPLVKRVAAATGARVCRTGVDVSINGRAAATALPRDHLGRGLPVWSGCRALGANQLFLLNAAPASLDARYFGATPTTAVVGRAVPLWLQGRR